MRLPTMVITLETRIGSHLVGASLHPLVWLWPQKIVELDDVGLRIRGLRSAYEGHGFSAGPLTVVRMKQVVVGEGESNLDGMTLDDKWTTLQALAVYGQCVRPKTYHMYDDALAHSGGTYQQYNLYLMMQYLVGQTIKDMYITVVNMGNKERSPTEKDFAKFWAVSLIDSYDQLENQQSVVDAMKPEE